MSHPLLNYTSQGEGQPLLIIHGLFGSSRNWQSLARQWASNYQVITLDLRNHGDSFHDQQMNYQVMTDDVVELLDHLGLDQIFLLGHSMGGKLAMCLSQQSPQLVKKLVVADIAPVAYEHEYDELIDPILMLDLNQVSNRKQADEELAASIHDQRIRLFLLQNLSFSEGRSVWKLNWPVLKNAMSSITGFVDISDWSILVPSLFIRGGLSPYVTNQHWTLIQQHFLQSQLVTLEKAGHWLHAEQPGLFYDQVSQFFSSTE